MSAYNKKRSKNRRLVFDQRGGKSLADIMRDAVDVMTKHPAFPVRIHFNDNRIEIPVDRVKSAINDPAAMQSLMAEATLEITANIRWPLNGFEALDNHRFLNHLTQIN
jgi:penicillin V acylase-like amidase (Ntn superfamily)